MYFLEYFTHTSVQMGQRNEGIRTGPFRIATEEDKTLVVALSVLLTPTSSFVCHICYFRGRYGNLTFDMGYVIWDSPLAACLKLQQSFVVSTEHTVKTQATPPSLLSALLLSLQLSPHLSNSVHLTNLMVKQHSHEKWKPASKRKGEQFRHPKSFNWFYELRERTAYLYGCHFPKTELFP